MNISKALRLQIIPYGKKFKIKLGEDLNEKCTKAQFLNKINTFRNFLLIGYGNIEDILVEDLGLFPKYEKFIIKDSLGAFVYSKFFIKGRWKRAERWIRKDSVSFFLYLMSLNEVAEDLEPNIISHPQLIYNYCKNVFSRKRIPDYFHNAMLGHAIKNPSDSFVRKYFRSKKALKRVA